MAFKNYEFIKKIRKKISKRYESKRRRESLKYKEEVKKTEKIESSEIKRSSEINEIKKVQGIKNNGNDNFLAINKPKGKSKGPRLMLDEAIAQIQNKNKNGSGMEGWSEARINAFKKREENPNSYYYRFNEPGESQKNGAWSVEEEELFMKRLKEFGCNGQWGLFSMAIPGRVGYQVIIKDLMFY